MYYVYINKNYFNYGMLVYILYVLASNYRFSSARCFPVELSSRLDEPALIQTLIQLIDDGMTAVMLHQVPYRYVLFVFR